jgi:hypothetical protein
MSLRRRNLQAGAIRRDAHRWVQRQIALRTVGQAEIAREALIAGLLDDIPHRLVPAYEALLWSWMVDKTNHVARDSMGWGYVDGRQGTTIKRLAAMDEAELVVHFGQIARSGLVTVRSATQALDSEARRRGLGTLERTHLLVQFRRAAGL